MIDVEARITIRKGKDEIRVTLSEARSLLYQLENVLKSRSPFECVTSDTGWQIERKDITPWGHQSVEKDCPPPDSGSVSEDLREFKPWEPRRR